MHQNKNIENTPETKSSTPEKSLNSHIIELGNTIGRTDQYAKLRTNGMPHTEAFATVARNLSEDEDSADALSAPDRALIGVMGQLGAYIDAEKELNTLLNDGDPHYLGQDERDHIRFLKEQYLIPFNHSVKELINTHPEANIRDVSTSLAHAYGGIFSKHDSLRPGKVKSQHNIIASKDAAFTIENAVNGMRHEVAAEALIDAAGYTFDRDVSTYEDATGSDLFVYMEINGKEVWVPIDVKASLFAEQEAHKKHSDSNAVWTGFYDGDFKGQKGNNPGALSVPYATTLEKSGVFIDRIYRMHQKNLAEKQAARQNAARVAARR